MNRIDWAKLAAYFAGECTSEEKRQIEDWLKIQDDQQASVEKAREGWEIAEIQRAGWTHVDISAAWHKIEGQIEEPAAEDLGSHPEALDSRPIRRLPRPMVQLFRVAAVVAAVGLSIVLFTELLKTPGEDTAQISMREVATERGQRARVQLRDGSDVRLNVDSKLTMPETFAAGTREVWLEGEAYFEIVPDADSRFIVHTSDAVIQVMGTEFNVKAYPEEEMEVIVADGEVSVRPERESLDEAVVLLSRQMARISKDVGRDLVVARDVDLARHLGWLQRRLILADTPLGDVVAPLERWYNLQIHFNDPALASRRLTASFEDEPATVILNVISESLGLRYERTGRAVTFYEVP